MENNYRKKLYSKYISAHTSFLYGKTGLEKIKKQFSVWQKIYGKFLPQDKNIKILDAGCGNGGFVLWLQNIGYKNVFGVDISEEQIEMAKKIEAKNIIQGDVLNYLENKENYFDIIFARDLIEHLNKDEILRFLEIIHKSLKKGGSFIIQAPNAEGPFGSRYRYADFTHEIAFTKSSLSQIFRATNFSKINFYPTRPPVYNIKSFVRHALWRIIELKYKFLFLVETGSPSGIFTQNIIAKAEK